MPSAIRSEPTGSEFWLFLQRASKAKLEYCLVHESSPAAERAYIALATILVRPAHRRRFTALFMRWAADQGWRLDKRFRLSTGSTIFRLVRDNSDGRLELACIKMITLQGRFALSSIEGRELMQARTVSEDVWHLPPAWRRAVTLLLAALGEPHAAAYMPDGTDETDAESILSTMAGTDLARQIMALENSASAAASNDLRRALQRRHLLRHPLSALLAVPGQFYRFAARELRPPGTFIAIMGPDGVGKTVLMDALEERLEYAFPSVNRHHWRPGLIPSLHRLRTGHDPAAPIGEKMAMAIVERRTAFLPSLMRLMYYGIDYTMGYWLRIHREKSRGSIVMCDRYFYDYFVDPGSKRITAPRWVLRAFCALYPSPQRSFILKADPNHVRARRSDLTLAEIARQNEAFRAIARHYPELELVDANQTSDITADHIIRRLFDMPPSTAPTSTGND